MGSAPAHAATATLTVQVNRSAAATSPVQWGHIVEDINHSVEGGLNANLVRNSTMKEGGANPPSSWSLLTSGSGSGSIATDTTTPLNSANASALKLTVTVNGGANTVGVANTGFYGVALQPSTTYTASFFARSSGGFAGAIRASLESTGGTSYASATTSALTGSWSKYTLSLTTPTTVPAGTGNRIAFYANGSGTGAVYLDVVQVLPPTYGSTGILRRDLMARLAATKPGFWRVPGGNYLEGNTPATRFDWKATLGAVESRPGHQNDAWGYWSTDQAGLKAYLDMAESTGAEPLLAVFAGYTLNGTTVAQSAMAPYVQDALDEIQYAVGATTTTWGARRAADGHPAPYKLTYVEIGNEDWFDTTGSYNSYRFPMLYDAIKAAYPNLQLVASTTVTSRTPDVIDDHYYNNDPNAFTGMATQYDGTDRNGPKHLVGEYAVTNGTTGNPTGTLGGALGEAGFMTGLLRNADVVVGASYAPALSHISDFQWPTNLIGFDAASSYGSPSYYVQQLFGANKGDYVVPTTFAAAPATVTQVATRATDGSVYVHVVNPTASAVAATVNVAGASTISGGSATVLTGDPAARNTITAPTTIAPVTSTFTASPGFAYTFPANSLTLLKFTVTGAVTPYLATDRGISLRVTTTGYTDRSVSASPGTGVTAVVSASSTDTAKKQASFVVRAGLADAGCYSFESRADPGQYLRQRNNAVVLAAPDGTTSFTGDATFCAVKGNGGTGISFTSKTSPNRYLRHYANMVYVATNGGSNSYDSAGNWAADTTFRVGSPWWRSDVDVTLGRHSLQATTPGYTGYSLRHYNYLAQIDPITASSGTATLQDATFTVVAGLGDSSCYSFQSVNFPTRYLRHYNYRVQLDVNDASATFAQDATFCAQRGNSGTGVSWQSLNFPNRYLRHYSQAVWVASNGGSLAADAPANWAADSSWNTLAPWAP
ncbi:MAG TPA: AbfB domain-containing protein [Kineosporiaceae bacterium]|nr:AbfB domain-containing protein [Kineosporiaceae bacterium]